MKHFNLFNKFFKGYFKAHIHKIIGLLLLIFGGVGLTNTLPFLYGKFIDSISEGKISLFKLLLIVYFSMTLVANLLSMIEEYIGEKISYKIICQIKKDIFAKIIILRCKVLDNFESGELFSRLNSDVDTVVNYYFNISTTVLTIIFNLAVALMFIFKISVLLSLIVLLFIPFSILINHIFKKLYRELQVINKKFSDKFYAFQIDTINNILGLRTYGQEKSSINKYQEFLDKQWELTKKGKFIMYKEQFLTALVSVISSITLFYFFGNLIIEGALTIGSMVSFITYMTRLTSAVSSILSLNMQAQNVIISMNRIDELMAYEDETVLKRNISEFIKEELKKPYNKLDVQNLKFAYGSEIILRDFCLSIQDYGLYSIVGLNGTGKSSFIKLMFKYYDYQSGTIILGKDNLKSIDVNKLREIITYVPKRPYITNESFYKNLSIANSEATTSEIEAAYKLVGLSDFIIKQPLQYETKLGENGKLLSSGQQQKLNIARALISKADIYLLDEITSDLDGKSEDEVMLILRRASERKVIIQVTHRISSVINSKEIFLLENGAISIHGLHNELINGSKLYRELFHNQGQSKIIEQGN